MQNTFLVDQDVTIVANSNEEKQGLSLGTVLKWLAGGTLMFLGVATIFATDGLGTVAGIKAIAGGLAMIGVRSSSRK